MKKIAIMGTGIVAQTLASKFITLGYDVISGTRNVAGKLAEKAKDRYGNPPFSEWHAANKSARLGTFNEAALFGEIILNATNGAASIDALKLAGRKNLNDKILIDISNPLDFSNGMPPSLLNGLSNKNSLGEEIQKTFPEAKVVKTLNTVWYGLMVNPSMINGGDHNIFISGNDSGAKETVKEILKSFGWSEANILDLGDIKSSRGAEMYLPFWVNVMGAMKHGAFNIKIVN